MKQRIIVFFIFSLFILSAKGYAASRERDSIPTKYKSDEEWYFLLQGGISYNASENTRFVNFWEVLSPQLSLSLGKRFTPVWGARLQLTGGDDIGVYFANDKNSPKYSFGHYGVMGIGTFSITEFLDRKKKRWSDKKWEVSGLFGLGAIYTAFDTPKKVISRDVDFNNYVYLSLYAGVEVARRLSPEWEVNAELSANWMNNSYNGQKTTTSSIFKADGLVNLLVGVRYTFNSTRQKGKTRGAGMNTGDRTIQPIVKNERNEKPAVVNEPAPILPVKVEEYYSIEDLLEKVDNRESIRGKMLASTERVFFDYGKSNIKTFTSVYLDKVVELLNKTNLVLVIKGFSMQGEPVMNNSLTERRMNAVRDYLVNHGIARDRLTYQYVELSGQESNANDLRQAVEFGILPL